MENTVEMGVADFVDKVNAKVAKSVVGRWFRLEGSGHPLERPGSKFMTEMRAGTITAASMIYIIVSDQEHQED